MDRWSIVTTLNYLPHDNEVEIVLAKAKHYRNEQGRDIVSKMVRVADLTRNAFMNGDISTVMSPRTVITWAENSEIFNDVGFAFRLTFLNKCDELERPIVAEFYQRCFGIELPESSVNVALSSFVMRGFDPCSIVFATGGFRQARKSRGKHMASNIKSKPSSKEFADRAVQARGHRLPARDRAQARSRSVLRRRAPRPDGRQGAAAGAAAQAQQGRGRDRARPCRLHRVANCLPRSGDASPPAAGRPAGARGVRGGRAGARRGDRRAAHGRRRQESHRHAGRALPPRQIRRDHRARRRADRGRAGAHGARAADRPGAAAGGQEAGRSLASADRGPRRARSRPAGNAWSRTSASSATRCTICSTRSKWATTAAAIPRRKTRKARRIAASRIPARTARPPTATRCSA